MHKKILAAALATFFSTGALASQVTINGAIDSYVAVNHMGGDGWESAISSGGVNASHVGLIKVLKTCPTALRFSLILILHIFLIVAKNLPAETAEHGLARRMLV